jgi:hypothetical protein
MLVFRKGTWLTIEVPTTDPLCSEAHRQELAASTAMYMEKGLSMQAASAEAERILYERLYPGLLISRE